ncbi:MAG: endonuclease/exonuclease/phosphatase family protein [Bacilli bacterium]|nr:endonuclease/exonuclease/phosphatase family protein [Bacilli bacterium]
MLTICTFNIQNDSKNYDISKRDQIISLLENKNIDIYNLQEVYSRLDKDLTKALKSLSYYICGTYRFLIPNRYNEKTPIITNKKIISNRTYHLPFLPSITKRIMTKVEIEDKGKIVSIYNTHLEYKYDSVKEKQLKKILKILKKDNNPIILTGDFNLKTNKEIFNNFVSELEKLGIQHIDVSDKTLKISKYHRAIDHIFISDDFKLISKKRITDINTSDHYPVLIKVDYK